MSTDRLVIVGASLAGLRAAQAARGAGFDGELIVVGDEPHRPYTRPPLSKEVLAGVHGLEECMLPDNGVAVDWRLGRAATALDLDRRELELQGGERLPFDRLVIATGARAREWTGPGAGLDGLITLRALDDAQRLQHLVAQPGERRITIVGAGFIGCEVTASLRKLGHEVTLLDVAPLPMPALGAELGERCAQLHRDHGVDLRLGTGIEGFEGDSASNALTQVVLADGTRIPADVAVVALGAVPNTEWLAGSGLTLNPGVVCDATLAAQGAEGVWAAGDAVSRPHPLAGDDPIRIEHWTNASEQGTVAGRNAVSERADHRVHASVPSFWSDQYDVKIQAVGLPRAAERVEVIEEDGDRFVAIGTRGDQVVTALAFNGARRLPAYRRFIADHATAAQVRDAIAADPTRFGASAGAAA